MLLSSCVQKRVGLFYFFQTPFTLWKFLLNASNSSCTSAEPPCWEDMRCQSDWTGLTQVTFGFMQVGQLELMHNRTGSILKMWNAEQGSMRAVRVEIVRVVPCLQQQVPVLLEEQGKQKWSCHCKPVACQDSWSRSHRHITVSVAPD